MTQYHSGPDLIATIKDIQAKIKTLANTKPTPVYTTATRPTLTSGAAGMIIFVTDGGAGNVFQGWNGSAWVSLG